MFPCCFLFSDIQNVFENVCLYEKNCCVQGENKELFTLLHKGDLIVFYGNSEQESAYVYIIFSKSTSYQKDDA